MSRFVEAVEDVQERSGWRHSDPPPSRAGEFTDEYLAGASDAQIESAVHSLHNDPAALDRVLAEMERRDEVRRQKDEDAQWAESWGVDPASAAVSGEGVGVDDATMAELEQAYQYLSPSEYEAVERDLISDPAMRSTQKRTAAAHDRQVRDDYLDWQFERYMEAEDLCRGHLLNKRGRSLGVDPSSLMFGNDKRMRAYASDEFKSAVGRLGGHVSFARFAATRGVTSTRKYGAHNLETFADVAHV